MPINNTVGILLGSIVLWTQVVGCGEQERFNTLPENNTPVATASSSNPAKPETCEVRELSNDYVLEHNLIKGDTLFYNNWGPTVYDKKKHTRTDYVGGVIIKCIEY